MIDVFKNNNIKCTKQRTEIYNLVSASKCEMTIKNIINSTNIDKTTIYRILDLFIKKGIFLKKVDFDGNVYYSIKEHIHYVVCIKCHKKTMIEVCPLENLKVNNYTILSHEIEFNGICDTCNNKV